VAHVDDFPRKELNRLIEPTAEDLQAGPSYAIHTAVLLGHDYDRCVDLQREFESEEMQALLAARFREERKSLKIGACIVTGMFLTVAGISWAIRREFTLLEFLLFAGAFGVWPTLSKAFQAESKFESWKLSEFRTWLVADIFQTDAWFSDWFASNKGNLRADPCNEISKTTGLPRITVLTLYALFRMRHPDEIGQWIRSGLRSRSPERL
jgi:hypothetical protein